MIRNFLFSLFFFSGIVFISLIFLPAILLPSKIVLFGGKIMGFWTSLCLKIFLSTKIIIKGKENIINGKKFFIAASHQSMFETFFLQTIFNSPVFILKKDSKIFKAYKSEFISERHRHRFEFNNDYLEQIEAAGMKATGMNPKTGLVEVVEISSHPWFVGVQYHPEYKSTVLEPHPLFVDFIKAALKQSKK